ncbi:hypothetical protein LXL04_012700 [Taraxacum kok-saghyz]
MVFNKIGDVKALGRCCVVSKQFHTQSNPSSRKITSDSSSATTERRRDPQENNLRFIPDPRFISSASIQDPLLHLQPPALQSSLFCETAPVHCRSSLVVVVAGLLHCRSSRDVSIPDLCFPIADLCSRLQI